MSATYPNAVGDRLASAHSFADRHPQLAPMLLAVAIVMVSTLVSLAITGLPT